MSVYFSLAPPKGECVFVSQVIVPLVRHRKEPLDFLIERTVESPFSSAEPLCSLHGIIRIMARSTSLPLLVCRATNLRLRL